MDGVFLPSFVLESLVFTFKVVFAGWLAGLWDTTLPLPMHGRASAGSVCSLKLKYPAWVFWGIFPRTRICDLKVGAGITHLCVESSNEAV